MSVSVTGIGEWWDSDKGAKVAGTVAEGGRVELDLAPLFEDGGAEEVVVRVDDPGFLPAMARVPVPSVEARAIEPVVELRFALELVAAKVVRGRVVDVDSRPIQGATVAVFAGHDKGFGPGAMDAAETDNAGAYSLRVRPGGDLQLVAAFEGLRPAQARLTGTEIQVPDLVLPPGAFVTGVVRGPDGTPAPGVRVLAEPETATEGFGVGRVFVTLVRGRVEHAGSEVVTDSSGRYRVQGLPEEWCTVRPFNVESPRALHDLLDSLVRRIRPPAADADLTLAGAWIDVEVREGGRPVRGATVEFVEGWWFQESDTQGRVTVLGRPNATCTLTVNRSGFRPWKGTVTTAGVGEHVPVKVDLKPVGPGGTLILVFEGPGAPVPKWVAYRCLQPGVENRQPDWATGAGAPKEGRLLLEELVPGPYHLVVRPGAERTFGTGYFLEESADVEVPAEGEREVRFSLRSGGRLRIGARDPEGHYLEAECDIRDPAGKDVDATFCHRFENGWGTSRGVLAMGVPNEVEPVLAPGRYSIRISRDGHVDREVEATVEAGRTTEVDVVLERRR